MITSIFWKRTYLFIEYTADAPMHLVFVQEGTGKQIPMESKMLEAGRYRSKLNFAIADGRGMFPIGKWQLFAADKEDGSTIVPILSEELLFRIEDCSRVFRYGNGRSAYIVTFDVKELADHTIGLFLEISFMKKNKKPEIRSKKAQKRPCLHHLRKKELRVLIFCRPSNRRRPRLSLPLLKTPRLPTQSPDTRTRQYQPSPS